MTMKSFTLELLSRDLKSCMDTAMQAADRSTKTPILQAVRISIVDGTASFAITNTDHSVIARSPAAGDGTVFLSFEMLAQKAAALRQDQPVTLAEDAGSVIIRQGKTRWKVPMIDGTGWPDAYFEAVSGEAVTIKTAQLFRALQIVCDEIAPRDTRIVGLGAYLDMSETFHVVGISGHGMRVVELRSDPLPRSAILPTQTFKTANSIFKEDEDVNICLSDKAISFANDAVIYRSKLVEGSYPDWRGVHKMHSSKHNGAVTFSGTELVAAINRASAINVSTTTGSVAARLTLSGDSCAVLAINTVGEEGNDACEVSGDSGSFAASAEWMVDAVNSLTGDELRIRFNTSDEVDKNGNFIPTSIIITDANPADDRLDYRLVMGMRA